MAAGHAYRALPHRQNAGRRFTAAPGSCPLLSAVCAYRSKDAVRLTLWCVHSQAMHVPHDACTRRLSVRPHCIKVFCGVIYSCLERCPDMQHRSIKNVRRKCGAHFIRLAYCLCNSFKPTQAFFRAALASAISLNTPACFLDTIALMTNRTPTIIATAMMRLMITFWIRPARMKFTKETTATVAA